MAKLILHCNMCDAKVTIPLPLPEGWKIEGDILEEEYIGFCPRHAKIAQFLEKQCPGCVSGWGEPCPLERAFKFARTRHITEDDLNTLREGRCPYRINGSLLVNRTPEGTEIKRIDLSEPDPAGGQALAEAIREYVERHGGKIGEGGAQ